MYFLHLLRRLNIFFPCFVLLRGTLPHEAKARSFNSTEYQTHARTQAECDALTQAECDARTQAECDARTQAECASYHWAPSQPHSFDFKCSISFVFGVGGIPLADVLSFKILLVGVGDMAQQLRAFVYGLVPSIHMVAHLSLYF